MTKPRGAGGLGSQSQTGAGEFKVELKRPAKTTLKRVLTLIKIRALP